MNPFAFIEGHVFKRPVPLAQNQVKLGLFSLSSAAPLIRCAILATVNAYSFHYL